MLAIQGHTYIGGASVPFFVSDGMLRSGGAGLGFDQIKIFDRSKFPIFQLPPIPSGTDNDWNTIAVGRRITPDGDVPVPSGVRWVVDITPEPVQQPMPLPAPVQTAPPIVSAGIEPDWTIPQRQVAETGPPVIDVPRGLKMPFLIGAGVIGGSFFAYQATAHFFGEGLTSKERRDILVYSGSLLALWAATELFNLNEWWMSPEGVESRAEDMLK